MKEETFKVIIVTNTSTIYKTITAKNYMEARELAELTWGKPGITITVI